MSPFREILIAGFAAVLALWLGVFAYMIDPAWMGWAAMPLPAWLRWLGVAILAIALLAASWFFLAAGVVVFALLGVRTRIEEEYLAARFGDAYRVYVRKTGRFFPRWPID